MNLRRKLVLALGAGALCAPFGAHAQQPGKVWRIGFLTLGFGPGEEVEAFREKLRELGYDEGRNLAIEYRFAAGNEERLAQMAADLVRQKVDIIVTLTLTVALAAKRATSTIPIVMAAAADPLGSGIVASLARPGGNVTGMSTLSTDLAGKRLQLLHELRPGARRVAVLASKGTASPFFIEQLRLAAKPLGITLVVQQVSEVEGFAGAFALMDRERAQALVVQSNPLARNHRKRIAELAAEHRLPSIFEHRTYVDAGGLMSYGPNLPELHRRAAAYVDKILKGAKPGDLPVEQPTKFELFINGKTAKALGIKIPQSLLISADKVIE